MCSPTQIRRAVALAVFLGTLGLGAAANATAAPLISTFEAPGAGNTPGSQQGTVGAAVNDFGVIAGSTRDENSVRHGYLRFPDGRYVVFDHPEAGTSGATGQGTRVGGLNALGAVAGSVRDANNFDSPYVRSPEGKFSTISFPNFGGGDGDAINLWGTMVGNYLLLSDPNGPDFLHFHGFLRSADGVITQFDPPGSTNTEIPTFSINDAGTVTGDYWVCSADLSSCTVHGFIRTANGRYTSFDAPGAGTDGYSGEGTYPQGINDLGEVSGYYVDVNFIFHGFVRSVDGRITSFDPQTVCTSTASPPADCAYNGTYTAGINLLGRVVGTYYGEDGNPHGFWRDADGTIVRFDAPGDTNFTSPVAINDEGQITGIVYDANIVVHGLLVKP
jgi:hypothetical protein